MLKIGNGIGLKYVSFSLRELLPFRQLFNIIPFLDGFGLENETPNRAFNPSTKNF